MAGKIAKELKSLQKSWKDAEPQELGTFTKVPDGDYVAEIVGMVVELSKNDRPQIVYSLEILEGKYEEKVIKKFDGLDNEMGIGYAKALLNLLEVEIPKNIAELPEAIDDWFSSNESTQVNMTVKTKDGYSNVYINSLADIGKSEKKKTKGKGEKEEKSKGKKGKEKQLDPDDIREMKKKDLKALIKSKDIDVDPEDYADAEELAEAIIEELDLE